MFRRACVHGLWILCSPEIITLVVVLDSFQNWSGLLGGLSAGVHRHCG